MTIESDLNARPSNAEPGVDFAEWERMPEATPPEKPKLYEAASDADAVRQASEDLQKLRSENKVPAAEPEEIDRSYRYLQGDRAGEKVEANLSLDPVRAANELTAVRQQEAASQQPDLTAKDVDAVREAWIQQQAAEQQPPAAEQPQQQTTPEQPQTSDQPQIDPEIAQALANPKIRAALEAEVAQADAQRQAYMQATAQASALALQSLLSQYPELQQFNAQQLPVAIKTIAASDPQKAANIEAHLNRVHQLNQANQQVQQQQQQHAQHQLQTWVAAEDAKFSKEFASKHSPEEMRAIAENTIEMAAELGVNKEDLMALYNSQPIMRSSAFQTMMAQAAQWRMAQKNLAQKIDKSVPPVQRPGTASVHGTDYGVEAAARSFQKDPSPQNAARMISLKRASR
jgi:hypothetical protein